MRQTRRRSTDMPARVMDDATLQRLYQWLKAGANPDSGC